MRIPFQRLKATKEQLENKSNDLDARQHDLAQRRVELIRLSDEAKATLDDTMAGEALGEKSKHEVEAAKMRYLQLQQDLERVTIEFNDNLSVLGVLQERLPDADKAVKVARLEDLKTHYLEAVKELAEAYTAAKVKNDAVGDLFHQISVAHQDLHRGTPAAYGSSVPSFYLDDLRGSYVVGGVGKVETKYSQLQKSLEDYLK